MTERAKLELGAQRDRQADTRFERHDLLMSLLPAPHFAAAGKDEPYFFDCAMCDGGRRLPGGEFEMGHAPTLKLQQNPHVGAVRGDDIRPIGQPHRFKRRHGFSLTHDKRVRRTKTTAIGVLSSGLSGGRTEGDVQSKHAPAPFFGLNAPAWAASSKAAA
jgi:hypothetical protein